MVSAVWLGMVLLLGLLVGSFLNVLIVRLPVMLMRAWQREAQSLGVSTLAGSNGVYHLAWPPSHCMACKTSLRWWQLVPLIAFLCLRGRCAHCAARIAWWYPVVELVATALACSAWLVFGSQNAWLAYAAMAWLLLAVSVIDWQHHILPDVLVYALLWLGLLCAAMGWSHVTPDNAVLAAVMGYLGLAAVAQAYAWVRRREGLGGGDPKLLAACAVWVGWQALPALVCLASIMGLVVGVCRVWRSGMRIDEPMAFGPYIALAAWSLRLWQHFSSAGEQLGVLW